MLARSAMLGKRFVLGSFSPVSRLVISPKPTSCELWTLEEPDEWWAYQQKIGNSFPLLYEVWQCVSRRPISSGQIEIDFGTASDHLTRKRGRTGPRFFQAQSTVCVNFPWLTEAADMPDTVMSAKTVEVQQCDQMAAIINQL